MKTKFSKLALIAAIGLAAAGTSYAHEDTSEAGTNHWLSHVSERQERSDGKSTGFVWLRCHEECRPRNHPGQRQQVSERDTP
jgi:hypothetical protein